jgi:hypothetical protein
VPREAMRRRGERLSPDIGRCVSGRYHVVG